MEYLSQKKGFLGYDNTTGFLTYLLDINNQSEIISGTKGTFDIGTTFSKVIKRVVGSATSKVNSSAFTLSNPLASSSTILPFSISKYEIFTFDGSFDLITISNGVPALPLNV